MVLHVVQEKILAQVEQEKKSAPPKAKPAAKAPAKGDKATAEEEEEEEEEDPVEAALSKYGIITEVPWQKDVK